MVVNPSPEQPRRRGRPPKAAPSDTGGMPSDPSSDPSSDPLLAAMRAVLQDELARVVTHVDGRISEVQARVVSLEQHAPSAQSLVDQAVEVLGPALSKQLSEKFAGGSIVAPNGSRDASEMGNADSGQPPSLSDKITNMAEMVGAVADVLLAKVYPLYLDHRKEARLDRQEARADRLLDTNPVAMRDAMVASSSPMLPYWSMVFAPTPQVVADARVRETTDALLVGMRARAAATSLLREDQTRQGETHLPGSPGLSGSPISTSPPSPTSPNAPRPDGVTMNSAAKRSQPRLTLREIMG